VQHGRLWNAFSVRTTPTFVLFEFLGIEAQDDLFARVVVEVVANASRKRRIGVAGGDDGESRSESRSSVPL